MLPFVARQQMRLRDREQLQSPAVAERPQERMRPWSGPAAVAIDLQDAIGNLRVQEALAAGLDADGLDAFANTIREGLLFSLAGFAPEALPGSGSNQAMLRRLSGASGGGDVAIPKDSGTPLPSAVKARMEAAFGHDFSAVRLHRSTQAARAAESLSARAFAIGADIFYGPDAPGPGTPTGERLLAHELTHVVQHDEGRIPHASGPGLSVSSPTDATELEAYANEDRILALLASDFGEGTASDLSPGAATQDAAIGGGDQQSGEPTVQRSDDDWTVLGVLSDIGSWILGVLAGDFNEDPSISQIVVRALLTLIPYVDQVGDIEDVVAALYKLIWQERYGEFEPWFDLVVTLIGAIPEAGSVAKGILKILKKGAKSIDLGAIVKFAANLGVGGSLVKAADEIKGFLKKLPEFGATVAERARNVLDDIATKADEVAGKLREAVKQGGVLVQRFADKMKALADRLDQLAKAARAAAKTAADQVKKVFAQIDETFKGLAELFEHVGLDGISRLLKHLSPAEILDFVRELGGKRLKELLDKYGGEALQHYGPAFFKSYKGATSDTIAHLLKNDGIVKGEIKGCHDADMFLDELVTQGRGKILKTDPNPADSRVIRHEYKLFQRDKTGAIKKPPTLSTGEPKLKTVMKDLASSSDTWKDLANEAADQAIKNKTMPAKGGKFVETTGSGLTIEGWIRDGKIDTFYPQW